MKFRERRIYARKREGMCIPTRRCIRQTNIGEVEGMECPAGDLIYHNTTLETAKKIADSGGLKVMKQPPWDQKALSFSSCQGQSFGGNIKFVVDTKGLPLEPMCYVGKEALGRAELGNNEERSRRAINLEQYAHECETVSRDDIPAKNVKKVQYWVPWDIDSNYGNMGCSGALPQYSRSDRFLADPVKTLQEKIGEAHEVAKKLGAEFEVKSCFTALKTGWGDDHYVPLNDRTLAQLAKGKTPKIVDGKVPQLCRC